jgi:hypothetical protein
MDPQTERWPHVDIVRDELRRLQAEQTAAEAKARAEHIAELKQHMTGYDKTRTRLEREKGKRDIRAFRRRERILRQTSTAHLTQRMITFGEKVLDESRKNGRPVTDR